MIEYKQLESGTPPDVEVATDDSAAEMAQFENMIQECEFDEIKLPEVGQVEGDGKFRFVVPGHLVGDFSDAVWDIDSGKLERLMEEWNQKALDEVEAE